MEKKRSTLLCLFSLLGWVQMAWCSDITALTFGSMVNVFPAAFGDFNSDELTDLFVITEDLRTVKILLASTKEPYFWGSQDLQCTLPPDYQVTSVAAGDFDGDALMDILVTSMFIGNSKNTDHLTYVFINWGNLNKLNCSNEPLISMIDEPLVIDYDENMISDLFGRNNGSTNVFWVFPNNRSEPFREIPLRMPNNLTFVMRKPHSHAFVDLNDDNAPDLFLTGRDGYGIWLYDNALREFVFSKTVPYPANLPEEKIGQNLFMDVETADRLHVVVPVCDGVQCSSSAIYVYAEGHWYNLNVSFADHANRTWSFIPMTGPAYTNTITLRSGDFNNDGYVDLLATLQLQSLPNVQQTYLLENVPCTARVCNVKRTFAVQWDTFSPANRGAVMGAFYDFAQDGILDVIFVRTTPEKKYEVCAFRNDLDYDANFIKVMVISGLKSSEMAATTTAEVSPSAAAAAAAAATLLTPKPLFGASLPGPKIKYRTTTQDGNAQAGVAVQLPQSAHFALHLPYTVFGLGRTPNFVEDLTVGMFNHTRTWQQIIPNSQMVVIPCGAARTDCWRVQLFVAPSKIVVQTAIALAGTCVVIALIIGVLHWKERREDRIEKLQEAHRFHFDAM